MFDTRFLSNTFAEDLGPQQCSKEDKSTNKMNKPLMIWMGSLLMLLSSCSTSTFYVVRHAERQSATDDATPLSDVGTARAQTLADMLASKGIDSVYSTNYLRCTQTATPTVDRLKIPLVLYRPHPTDEIIKRLKNLRNQQALVVGHSNTVLDIVKGLGATPTKTEIKAGDYDNLFVVTVRRKLNKTAVSLQEQTFRAK